MMVQPSSDTSGVDAGQVKSVAAQGIQGPSQALPHADKIQKSFGEHDISNVQAHVGGPATEACSAMGAKAYTSGNHVGFKNSLDLRTAAHEATHVIQQRAGVSLDGGVGKTGDPYELEADAVADKVVQGRSVEHMLGQAQGGTEAVQAKSDARTGDEDEEELLEGLTVPSGFEELLGGLREWLKAAEQEDGEGAKDAAPVQQERVVQMWTAAGHEQITSETASGAKFHISVLEKCACLMDKDPSRCKGYNAYHGEAGKYSWFYQFTAKAKNVRQETAYLMKAIDHGKWCMSWRKVARLLTGPRKKKALQHALDFETKAYIALGDALHVAQDRGAHGEGLPNKGHKGPLGSKCDNIADNKNGYPKGKLNSRVVVNVFLGSSKYRK